MAIRPPVLDHEGTAPPKLTDPESTQIEPAPIMDDLMVQAEKSAAKRVKWATKTKSTPKVTKSKASKKKDRKAKKNARRKNR